MLTINDQKKIESTLNIQLPQFFKTFHLEETKLIEKLRTISNDDDHITLATNVDWLIEWNRDMLKLPNNDGICRNKICIGTDGCGNDSFISILGNDERVFQIDHEEASELIDADLNDFLWEDERMEKYGSLREYVQYNIDLYEELRNE